jgi:RNA polymerase sigma factor (sigma-70 family)
MTSIEFCAQLLSLETGLRKFAYSLSLKKDDADDLVQETFLKVLTKRDKFVNNENFKSWTFTIMKNTFVDSYRRTLSRNTHRDPSNESFFINTTDNVSFENPDSTYSAMEIEVHIDKLKDKLKIPFQMYVEGYKYSEIAKELNLKLGTVKNRIFLSRKQLMAQLNS